MKAYIVGLLLGLAVASGAIVIPTMAGPAAGSQIPDNSR
jgi:hypothetical protein